MCVRRTAFVLVMGCPVGHTASTSQPALARAIPSRAVGYQREVVTNRTVGLMFWKEDESNRLEMNQSAALAEGFRGSFEHLYDSQACFAIVHRRLVIDNAVHEVCQLLREGFGLFDARRPHIS